MLLFKGRPRKSPNLADDVTPSQRRIMRLLGDARERVQDSIDLAALAVDIDRLPAATVAARLTVEPWMEMQQALADELRLEMTSAGQRVKLQPMRKTSYRGAHKAPRRGEGAPMHDLTGEGEYYPEDVYGDDGARLYGSGAQSELAPMEEEVIEIVRRIRGKPQAKVTVYRALPPYIENPTISRGDWVTPSRAYAEMHGASNLQGEYQVVSVEADASDLFTEANSLLEWGYDPPSRTVVSFRFDAVRAEAGAWADKEAAALIVEISDQQREVVRDLIVRSTRGEYTVAQVARQVRGSIGLTDRQAGWVENFRQRKIDEARDRGVPAERAADEVQAEVDRYHRRIHRYRSETIARTETIRASSEGRQAAWRQGIEEGFISPYAHKQWVVEYDGCDICKNNGDLGPIRINDEFPSGEPPAHPNCRCDVILVDDEIDADLLEMTDEELAAEIESLIEAGPATPAPIPEPGEAGGLPKWARDRGIDSLLAELPEDRSQIGYRTESEADAIRRWENDHSDWADDIEVIRREGREADERLPAVDSLREKVDANRRKMEELVAGEQKMTPEELDEYTRLAQEAHDIEDEIRDTEFKVRRRDEAEATIARQKEKITDWRDTLEARTIVDIDEVSGKPGPALRRQLEIVQEVGSAVEAEVQSRLPERLRGVAARRIALGEIDEEDLRTITETREQVLAEIRPMDEGQDNFKGATSDEAMTRNNRTGANYPGANLVYAANEGTMGAVGRALDVYPTAWIERMGDDQGEITVMRADRGFSDTRAPLISVSGQTPERELAVAVHEVGHRMQISTPGLRILEWALLRSRTVGDGPPPLAQISDAPEGEMHLIGSTFRHSYTARIYEKASESTIKLMSSPMGQQRVSFEVFPTGTQATFPRSKADVAFADLDGSFQDWTLGVLASL